MNLVDHRHEYHRRVFHEIVRISRDSKKKTGDLDCVYHVALPELRKAIEQIKNEDQA